jgi:hypothetical protein
MIGTPVVAALIALCGFWALLSVGWLRGELGFRRVTSFVGLWLVGLLGFRYLPYGESLFPPYVAALDVALVFAIFKGDVRLT